MNGSETFISANTARQILVAAEQNGMTVENYLQKIAKDNASSNGNSSQVRKAKIKFDFTKTNEWLKNNRLDYAGKWIVLDGDRLIGAGENPLPLVEKAHAEGVKIPFVHFINDDSEPFMAGYEELESDVCRTPEIP